MVQVNHKVYRFWHQKIELFVILQSFVNVESMQPRQPEDGNVASDELKSNMVANYRNMLVKLECFSGHDIKITNRDVNELLQVN